MVTFTTVRWKNFLSTGNAFTEIQLDQNPSTLVVGENGAGKSTILDALCFVLFNKPFRQISKSQLLNSINQREAIVEVEFTTQNKKVKVVRGIKPNMFEIYVNDIMINQNANAKDYQKHLEQQILKFNYRSFTQVVILGSSTFVPFMQLNSRARREVVEDILDIKIFSLMNLVLKTKVKEVNTNLTDSNYATDLTKSKIEIQEKYIEDTKNNRKNLLSEKTNIVDFAFGVAPGVFAIVYSEDDYVNYEMEYLKMGKGPYWTLYRPYHLTSLEIPRTIMKLMVDNETQLSAKKWNVEVVAHSKKDLKAGTNLGSIGGENIYGKATIEDIKELKEEGIETSVIPWIEDKNN